jgi:dihydrofolate reductase
MARLTLLMNMTLDGFCDHDAVLADDDLHANATHAVDAADVVALGGATYDLFVDHWPEVARTHSGTPVENEFADRLEGAEKVVFSASRSSVDWPGARLHRGDAVGELSRIVRDERRSVVIVGSARLARSAIAAGIVDEYRLPVQPIVRGGGVRLFDRDALLMLERSTPFSSGAVELRYRSAL